MKKNIYLILTPLLFVLFACEKDEFLEFEKSGAPIIFDGYPAYTGSFTTIDQVNVTVAAEGAESLVVEGYAGGAPTGFSVNASGGSVTVQESWSAILGGASLSSLEGAPVTLRATATISGETSYRDLTLSYNNPLSFNFSVDESDFITAESEFPDSTFNVYYNVSTLNTSVNRVDFYAKVDTVDNYPDTPFGSQAIGATSAAEQTFSFAFPGEDSIGFGTGLDIRVVAVGANDLTDDLNNNIEAVEVPLNDEGEIALLPDNFVIVPSNETDSAIIDIETNGFDFSEASLVADDSTGADLRLGVDMGNLVIDLAAGVEYVIVDGNSSVNGFQSARDIFAAGTANASGQITDLAQLSANASGYIILSIPDLAAYGTGSGEFVVLRIENVDINAAVVEEGVDPIENSRVTLSYQGNLP